MDRVADLAVIDVTSDFTALGAVAIDDEQPQVRQGGDLRARGIARMACRRSPGWHRTQGRRRSARTDCRRRSTPKNGRSSLIATCSMRSRPRTSSRRFARPPADLEAPTDPGCSHNLRVRCLGQDIGSSQDDHRFLYDEERLLRLAAVTAMGSSGFESWLDYLDEQLQSVDAEFRAQRQFGVAN